MIQITRGNWIASLQWKEDCVWNAGDSILAGEIEDGADSPFPPRLIVYLMRAWGWVVGGMGIESHFLS